MIKHKKDYDVPLSAMANILYNTAKKGIYDPELYANYEKQMPFVYGAITSKQHLKF